jgi:predicted porin
MNKKLMAVAVAGLFAAPAVALAQSSVTISGLFKGGYENLSIGSYNNNNQRVAPGANAGNSSQNGVVDDSSRIIFNVTEDLGGGLAAIGQIDMRFAPDVGTLAASGNTFFGLRSTQWGTISFGRRDLHYFNRESNLTDKASLRADSISLLAYAGGGSQAIAGATRTNNVVHYLSPNWSGFTFILAYSSNAPAQDADLSSAVGKGSAWNFNPNYQGANWQVGYSYWESKPDVAGNTFATGKQRSDRLYGSYVFPFGLKLGLAWDKSKIDGQNVAPGGVQLQSDRDVWSIPIGYTWGNHNIYFHYDKANDDKKIANGPLGDQGAKMWAIAYAYDLSKRTSVALTYAEIKNNGGAQYNFFTSAALGLGTNAVAAGVAPGEDPKMFGLTMRHQF